MNDELTDEEAAEMAPTLDPVRFISDTIRTAVEDAPGGRIDADQVRTTVAMIYSMAVKLYGLHAVPEPHTFNDAYTYVDALNREAWDNRDTEAIRRISEKHPECETMGDLVAKGLGRELTACFPYSPSPSLPGFLASKAAARRTPDSE